MLNRATRQIVRCLMRPSQVRAFGSAGGSHEAGDHHDAEHGHHQEHRGYVVPIKFVHSYLGRNSAPNLTPQPDIPHDNPADPGYDVTAKRKNSLIGTKLNPTRHTYMHQLQLQYDDKNFIGDFPSPDIIGEREPSKIYKEQAVQLTIQYLSNRVKGFDLQTQDWNELKSTSWQLHGVDNINDIKFEIFDYLGDNIVVKESKYRPRIEQRLRKSVARE